MTDYERFGDFQPAERGGRMVTALTFLLVGLGLGAGVALLMAPSTGRQTRKKLRRRYEDARDTLSDLSERAEHMVERGGEIAQGAGRKVSPITKRFRRRG